MSDFWKFSSIPCIEEAAFNKVLERFYDFGISGLVRENIQNSLDGRLPQSEGPVVVTIKTGTIHKDFIPGIEEIKERIHCLEGRNSYTKETIAHMKNKMDEESVAYISFEDSNTKGLRGARNGQSTSKDDTWSIYAYNKGVHSEESDQGLEKSRGGSHGIGKIASNAASELYMMYFANCDEFGDQHLGGTVQLIEHQYQGNYYRSTGYFTDVKQVDEKTTKFYPFENHFHEVFEKKTRGLKIIIPFLRDQFNKEDEIIKSICDSFFVAILQQRLEVIVNDKPITATTIEQYVKNADYYVQKLEEIKDEFTPLYFDTYTKSEPQEIVIKDTKQEYHFNLYFNYNPSISKGRVAIIRTIGMKIEDKKVKNNVNKPFNAVLIPKSMEEDAFLKSLENESHTELSDGHIKDQKEKRNAKRFINNISNVIAKVIEDAIKKNNPTDGLMDTGDVLYEVENQFKQDLAKSSPTVQLNHGKKEQTLVKVKPESKKTKKRQQKEKGQSKSKEKKPPKQVKNRGEHEENIVTFKANPEMVERILLNNRELVKFDFSTSYDIKRAKTCSVSLAVIDGMGNEYDNEFSMNESYESAKDLTTGSNLAIEGNLIKNVSINKGIAQLDLKLKSTYNKSLKFVYYVEVAI
ncbi:MAG: hypothetical protein Q3980_11675 [Turicibacter sp.]|nr:hypothetical protein [Turicibacter sp.]